MVVVRWIGRFVPVDDGFLLTVVVVVVVVVVDVDAGRLMWTVVDVEGEFVGLCDVVILVASVGCEVGLNGAVVLFGGVVRVGVVVVGAGNVVCS